MNLKQKNKIDPNFSMSGLTDIMFLLLIFFLLTSSLVSLNALDVILPSANGKVTEKPNASITITADEKIYFDTKLITLDQLRQALEIAKVEAENYSVVLNAEKTATVENMVEIFTVAKDLGIPIILATQPIKK